MAVTFLVNEDAVAVANFWDESGEQSFLGVEYFMQ
jgi:hypothetical protein